MFSSIRLPRNAQLWLPGYIRSLRERRRRDMGVHRVWLTIADHFEPLRGGVNLERGLNRVEKWRRRWPEIASRHADSTGRQPVYSFFFPEEEYRPVLMDPLAAMKEMGIGDVEIHIHHDREGQQSFVDRMEGFKEILYARHGLLRKERGQIRFGFIHGSWALDNSLPGGQYCGLNNELTLLRDLGCYADFTLPSAPSLAQARMVNTIYWAQDDPLRPKSYDTGLPLTPGGSSRGDLLMIAGPLALNWVERRGVLPRLETGELAAHNPVTPERVRLWLEFAPRIGHDMFIKLFAHGALEVNLTQLLSRDLDFVFQSVRRECERRGAELHFVSAWEMKQAVDTAAMAPDRGSAAAVHDAPTWN